MVLHAERVILCFLMITFRMEFVTAAQDQGLLVTLMPDPNLTHTVNRSYDIFPISESGLPGKAGHYTFFNMSVFFPSVCVDYQSDTLFLYEYIRRIIYIERNHSQSNIRTWTPFLKGPASVYTRVAFDWLSRSLYWTDTIYGWIGIMGTTEEDLGMYKILLHEDIEHPHGIALDPFQGFLFWTDIGGTVKIERSSLSGKKRKVLIYSELILPYSIVADVRTQNIFWIDDGRDSIESAQYDGTGRQIIARITQASLFDIEVFKDLLYVADDKNKMVHIVNKTSMTDMIDMQFMPDHIPFGVKVFHPDGQPINGTDYCATLQCSNICVNTNEGAVCMCSEGYNLNDDGKSCSEGSRLFRRGLIMSNSTAMCVTDIYAVSSSGYNMTCFTESNEISHFELDTIRRQIVFANSSGLYYISANQSVRFIFAVTGTISGLGFDWIEQNIYWSEKDTGNINVMSWNKPILFTILSGLDSPQRLLTLTSERRLLWVSGSYLYTIESSNFQGIDRKVVAEFSSDSNLASIGIDPSNQRVYFVDNTYIRSCNLDGSDVRVLANAPSNTEGVYIYKGYLLLNYQISWNFQSSLKTFAIEDPNLTEKKDENFHFVGKITDVKVFDESLQPIRKGPCDEQNGGCEQICIPTGPYKKMCRCRFGFHQVTPDGKTCVFTPVFSNFLLVSDRTNDMLYQLSLDTGDVEVVINKTIKGPTGVAYDHTRKTVVWGSSGEQQIVSARIDGSIDLFIFRTGDKYNAFPDRFDIDFSTGNIYYTAGSLNDSTSLLGGYIAVLSINGLHKRLLTGLDKPRAIVVHPSKGIMFWTDHGVHPHIGQADMDGQNSIIFMSDDVLMPNGLAIDYLADRLYWSDGSTDSVQSCYLNGSDKTGIFADAGAHLMDISIDNAGYLYYTALNRPYITKLTLSRPHERVRLFEKPELGFIDAMKIYKDDRQPRNVPCSYNNGNCNMFCLPKTYGSICACEDGFTILEDRKTCSNVTSSSDNKKQIIIFIAAGCSAGFVAAVILTICWLRKRRRSKPEESEPLKPDETKPLINPDPDTKQYDTFPAISFENDEFLEDDVGIEYTQTTDEPTESDSPQNQ